MFPLVLNERTLIFETAMMNIIRSCVFALIFLALPRSAAADRFGALAYDYRSGSWGAAWDHLTLEEATAQAIRGCGKKADQCVVVVTFSGGCAAYATGPTGASGWATASVLTQAKEAAVKNCAETGPGCAARVWGCNTHVQPPLQHP